MQEVNPSTILLPGARQSLNEVLRRGAQMLLAQAIEAKSPRKNANARLYLGFDRSGLRHDRAEPEQVTVHTLD